MTATQLLDGEWRFFPLISEGNGPTEVASAPSNDLAPPPDDAYASEPILVPGTWNDFPDEVGGDWGAYDVYGYPKQWRKASAGWYQRRFRLDQPLTARARCRLVFDAVLGAATIRLNGTLLGHSTENFLPFAFDVTDVVHPTGENVLEVRVDPPPRKDGLWLQPCGSWFGWHGRGIWQSVRLEFRPAVAITDVFAQPSVRQGRLAVDVTVAAGGAGGSGEVAVTIEDAGAVVLDLGTAAFTVSDSGATTLRFERPWPNPRHWSPDDPHLYHAVATLTVADAQPHVQRARFGFREFWIEGTEFRLNGQPIRLFGDSWHYMGPVQQNPAYARTWYTFAKRIGVNAIRTHAQPYPPFYFDLADEMGMLIIDESAVYGSAGTLAYDEPVFWDNAREHMRRLVRRDRNHPSIIFWSACNETVWKGGEKIYAPLASLADEAEQLDPTRFVSFDENDCDVGGRSPVHCGHYGTPQHWDRVWKRDKPLVVHEFSALYHGGPEAACPLGGDAVYASFTERLRATGEDAADMFLKLRALGAASITPWNLNWYSLYPIPVDAVESVPDELTAGGAPLRRIGPRAVTLNYGFTDAFEPWEPNEALAPLQACYRRKRFWVTQRPAEGFVGDSGRVDLEIWNDHHRSDGMHLEFAIADGDDVIHRETRHFSVSGYGRATTSIEFDWPHTYRASRYIAKLTLTPDDSDFRPYVESWPIQSFKRLVEYVPNVTMPSVRGQRTPFRIGTPADGEHHVAGLRCLPANEVTAHAELWADPQATLILSPHPQKQTLGDWLQDTQLADWLRRGGRLIVLPEAVLPDMTSALNPVSAAPSALFLRDRTDGGIFRDLISADGLTSAVRTAACGLFQRPATGPGWAPLDVGDPAEGLTSTPLLILNVGAGHVVRCGFDLLQAGRWNPSAQVLLERLVHERLPAPRWARALILGDDDHWRSWLESELGVLAQERSDLVICDGRDPALCDNRGLTAQFFDCLLDAGGTVLVDNLTRETVGWWNDRLGLSLQVHDACWYNLATDGQSDWTVGINNQDLCWVLRDEKQPIVREILAGPADLAADVTTAPVRWENYQATAEQCKVAMMLRRVEAWATPPRAPARGSFAPGACVVQYRRGRGRIIISQLLLRAARGPFKSRATRIMSRMLDSLGVDRDARVSPLAPRQRRVVDGDGFITDWLVLGPFAADGGQPLDRAFVEEAALVPAGEQTDGTAIRAGAELGGRTWQRVASAFSQVDLDELWPNAPARDRVAYAAIHVYSPQDRSVLLDAPDMIALRCGADGGTKPLLNGHPVGRFDFVRDLVLDADRVDGLPLRQGWNLLVIKLHNPGPPWRFAARLMTAAGEPARDLTFALTPTDD
jgi:hypothetical protein